VPNIGTDVGNIRLLMKTFEEAYREKLNDEFEYSPIKEINLTKIEREIRDVDAQIDRLIFNLYGLTDDEIEIIEKIILILQ